MRFVPSLSIAFFGGVALLALGQRAPGYETSAVLSLLGGALLIVVAIRGLAGLAGLHQPASPRLDAAETVLVESHDALVEAPALLVSSRRGPYRARLTNRRLLLSLRVMRIVTGRDVTAALLSSGQPLSVRAIEVRSSGEIVLTPERRFGPRLRLWVHNPEDWRQALHDSHPELLRHELSTST